MQYNLAVENSRVFYYHMFMNTNTDMVPGQIIFNKELLIWQRRLRKEMKGFIYIIVVVADYIFKIGFSDGKFFHTHDRLLFTLIRRFPAKMSFKQDN
jgi:hypothetical protein